METKNAVIALAALAQETRLAVFRLLVEAGRAGVSAGEICEAVKTAPATLSFHLKEMSHAGLIESRQDGRYLFYSANYERMNELLAFLTDKCCARDGLDCGPGCKPASGAALARAAKPKLGNQKQPKRRVTAR